MSAEDNFFGGDGDGEGQTAPGVGSGTEAGAAGDSSANSITISTGAMVAIIIVAVGVAVLGASTAVLFYIAKKREWTIRETVRKSARKVVTALTPKRTEFPDFLKDPEERRGGRTRIADEIPPTPRLRPEDVEKAMAMNVRSKPKNWSRK